MAAVLASIPIVTVLSMMMMHHEGQSAMEISGFAKDIVWLLIPSLLMFIVMPWLIESRSWEFYPALAAGLACTGGLQMDRGITHHHSSPSTLRRTMEIHG